MRTKLSSCLVALFVMSAFASAAEPLYDGCRWYLPRLRQEWNARKCWCPDDYDRKKQPCVSPNQKGCVDDYCRKSLPCVPPNPKGCKDDYCPKNCPLYLGCLCQPWYSCGSPPCGNPCAVSASCGKSCAKP
jgi:hypothetical protein